jgi:type IV secretory pathway VirB2 component (pilin)
MEKSPKLDLKSPNVRFALITLFLITALALLPNAAHAQTSSFDVPFIQDFGCAVVKWMKGPLAILIFVIVIFATLVIGMIARMDWAKVISVAVIFGVISGLAGFMANNQYMQGLAGLAGCLQ